MQSLILPHSSFTTTPFGQPRFNQGPERLQLNLSRSINARGYIPRASPPPRSMSGSPPAEDSLEAFGETKYPGRSEASHPATTTGVSQSILTSGPPATVSEPSAWLLTSNPIDDISPRRSALSDPFTPSRPLPTFSGQGISQAVEPVYRPATLATSPPGTGARALPQKTTRRTKAHVASACVNCKKKHLGCDPARPCRRCVLAGKASTCVDVTHKKRGRPPLKAEEPSLRPFTTPLENPAAPVESQPSSHSRRIHGHRSTFSREIRPTTDLHVPSGAVRGLGLHPQRWSASAFPPSQAIDPSLSIPGGMGQRSFSVGSPQHFAATTQQPSFLPTAGGFSPSLGVSRMPAAIGRPFASYATQPIPPAVSPPQYPQQQFGGPVSPYLDRSRAPNRPPAVEPSLRRESRESFPESPVRLPPIFSAMTDAGPSPQAHRLSDPYPPPWSLRSQEPPPERRAQPPLQGLAEPVSPHTPLHRSPPELGRVDPLLRHRGPMETTVQTSPVSLPSGDMRAEHASPEAEPEDSRPTKRRKMALDDMVND